MIIELWDVGSGTPIDEVKAGALPPVGMSLTHDDVRYVVTEVRAYTVPPHPGGEGYGAVAEMQYVVYLAAE